MKKNEINCNESKKDKKNTIEEMLKNLLKCKNMKSKEGKNLIQKVNEIESKNHLCLSLKKELNYYQELNSYLRLNLKKIKEEKKKINLSQSVNEKETIKINELFSTRRISYENIMKKYIIQIEKLKIEKNNIIEKYSPILNNIKKENVSLIGKEQKQKDDINQYNEIIQNILKEKEELIQQKEKDKNEFLQKEKQFLRKIEELEKKIKFFSHYSKPISNPILNDNKISNLIITNENLNITLKEKELENSYLKSTLNKLESRIKLSKSNSKNKKKNLSQYYIYNYNTLKKSNSENRIKLSKKKQYGNSTTIQNKQKNSIFNISSIKTSNQK